MRGLAPGSSDAGAAQGTAGRRWGDAHLWDERNEEQLRANLKASDFVLDPAEIPELDKVSALPAEYPGWVLEALRNQGRAPKNAR